MMKFEGGDPSPILLMVISAQKFKENPIVASRYSHIPV